MLCGLWGWMLISTAQPLQLVYDVHQLVYDVHDDVHIQELLICNALHEALKKNDSLQSTSSPWGIIKLTYKGHGNTCTDEFVITLQTCAPHKTSWTYSKHFINFFALYHTLYGKSSEWENLWFSWFFVQLQPFPTNN